MKFLFSLFSIFLFSSIAFSQVIYVKADANGSANGTSWLDAYPDLSVAIAASVSGDTITVASGKYHPGTERSNAFILKDGVKIFGGFQGSEIIDATSINDRDWLSNASILTGEIQNDADSTNNSYHVVYLNGPLTSGTKLDGFIITEGYANASGDGFGGGLYITSENGNVKAQLSNLSIENNSSDFMGGGMALRGIESDTIQGTYENIRLLNNRSLDYGGGLAVEATYLHAGIDPNPIPREVIDVTFNGLLAVNNSLVSSGFRGSAIFLNTDWLNGLASGSETGIIHCNFYNTTVYGNPGSLALDQRGGEGDVSSTFINSIIWNEGASSQLRNLGGVSQSLGHSMVLTCIESGGSSCYGATDLGGNVNGQGENGFVNAAEGDFRLFETSPAANAGIDSLGTHIGYIQSELLDPATIPLDGIYVNPTATGAQDGSSWTDAFTDLQDALAVAINGDRVFVSKGMYQTTSGTDRSVSFILRHEVSIYGGLDGEIEVTEQVLSDRDFALNESILTGEIGEAVIDDNAYHVVQTLGSDGLLDGFTIEAGNANDLNGSNELGGGLFIDESNSIYRNLIIRNNHAINGGGIYIEDFGSPSFENIQVLNNEAEYGGGIDIEYSSPSFEGLLVCGNIANVFGGGIYDRNVGPGSITTSAPVVITNATITNNHADYESFNGAGGIYQFNYISSANMLVQNSIVWGNTHGTAIFSPDFGDNPEINGDSNGLIRFSNSILKGSGGSGNWASDIIEDAEDLGDNLDDDPLFQNPDECDVTLTIGSAAADTGDPDFGVNIGYNQGPVEEAVASLTIEPMEIDFGTINVGNGEESGIEPISLSGRFAFEDITVSAPAGFGLSTTAEPFEDLSNLVLPGVGSGITSFEEEIFVKVNGTSTGVFSGEIQFSSSDFETKTIAVTSFLIDEPVLDFFIESTSIDLGNVVVGQTRFLNYQVEGSNLKSDLTIESTGGFELSLSEEGEGSTSLTLSPTEGILEETNVFITITPTDLIAYTGTITHTTDQLTPSIFTVEAEGVPEPTITVTPDRLVFEDTVTRGESATLGYFIEADNLFGEIEVTSISSSVFEVSLDSSLNNFSGGYLLPPTENNDLPKDTLFVKFRPGFSQEKRFQTYEDYIFHSFAGVQDTIVVKGVSYDPEAPFIEWSTDTLRMDTIEFNIEGNPSNPQSVRILESTIIGDFLINAPLGFQISRSENDEYSSDVAIRSTFDSDLNVWTLQDSVFYVRYNGFTIDLPEVPKLTTAFSGSTEFELPMTYYLKLPPPEISVDGQFFRFGPVNPGEVSTLQNFGLNANFITEPVTITTTNGFILATFQDFADKATSFIIEGSGYRNFFVRYEDDGNQTGSVDGELRISSPELNEDIVYTLSADILGQGSVGEDPQISVEPDNLSFGIMVLGETSSIKSFDLSGSNLESSVSVIADPGSQISLMDGENFEDAGGFSFTTSGSISEKIYVRINPTSHGDFMSQVSVTYEDTTAVVTLTATVISNANEPVITYGGQIDDFGYVETGSTSNAQMIEVSAINLTDDLTATVSDGFLVSNDAVDYSGQVSITPFNGVIDNQSIFIQFNPGSASDFTGNLTLTSSGVSSVEIGLTGTSIETPVLGISEEELNELQIYPNPSPGKVEIKSIHALTSVKVFNVNGKQVFELKDLKQTVLNLENLAEGVYWIRVGLKDHEAMLRKLIVY